MTRISKDQDVMTLVNVFTVDADNCDELTELLVTATRETMQHVDGFVSANIHRSHDSRRVVNYAQWEASKPSRPCEKSLGSVSNMRRAAELAETFDPILCTVIHTNP